MDKIMEVKEKMISRDTRAFRRLRSFSLVKYTVANDPLQKKLITNPRDISAGGASFISGEELPVNSILEMDIYLPPLKDFITVMASVVRALKIKALRQYLVGVRFTAIDPENRTRMSSYIENMAKDPSMRRHFDKKARLFRRTAL